VRLYRIELGKGIPMNAKSFSSTLCAGTAVILLLGAYCSTVNGASPSIEQALSIVPIQEGVNYSSPKPAEISKCKIVSKKFNNNVGWVVEGPDGATLRKFIDTNGDNKVDQWSFYLDGVEVYRDIDSKFSGKADQFRWLNASGSRWGVDENGDEKIDSWRILSPEEATSETVAALANRVSDRFASVLLTPGELQSLGLGNEFAETLKNRIDKARKAYESLISQPSTIPQNAKWLQFGGSKPSVIPAGTNGSAKDLHIYENAAATVQAGDKFIHVRIGGLVKAGDAWKAIDAPVIEDGSPSESEIGNSFSFTPQEGSDSNAANSVSEEMQKQLAELETYDFFDPRRVDVLERLAKQARNADDQAMWYQQIADTLSASVQSGKAPEGLKQLQSLAAKLKKGDAEKSLIAYVVFRILTAEHAQQLQAPKVDYAKIQTEFNKRLEQFVADFPTAPDAAEAMLQLGIACEFDAKEEEAKTWYGRIVKQLADSPAATKAAGAVLRLDSVAKPLAFSGNTLSGKKIELSTYRGKVVLIHYWATWSDQCKQDLDMLKKLVAEHRSQFSIIGVCLDNRSEELNAFLKQDKLPWAQIFEKGGMDSPPANQLGILLVPTMILIDQQGVVVNRAIRAAEIEAELKKLIR
jgi:thiol-disulfide isomerase/thioredoxin